MTCILIRGTQKTHCLNVNTVEELRRALFKIDGIPTSLQKIYHGHHMISADYQLNSIPHGSMLQLHLNLVGGKGGFGAKLKNEGSKKVRSGDTNHSRDLTGRRIKNVNMYKEFIEQYKKKIQEDKTVKEEREKFKLRENTLYEEHAFMRLDKNYTAQLDNDYKNIEYAFKKGLNALKTKNVLQEVDPIPYRDCVYEDQDEEDKYKDKEEVNEEKYQTKKRPREYPIEESKEYLDIPRKQFKKETPEDTKIEASRIIAEVFEKPLIASTGLSNAALKLQSLFKKK